MSTPAAAAAYWSEAPRRVEDGVLEPGQIVTLALHGPAHRRMVWWARPVQLASTRQTAPLLPGAGAMVVHRRQYAASGCGLILDVPQLCTALSCSHAQLLQAAVAENFGLPIIVVAEFLGCWQSPDGTGNVRAVARPLAPSEAGWTSASIEAEVALAAGSVVPRMTSPLRTQMQDFDRNITAEATRMTVSAWKLAGQDPTPDDMGDIETACSPLVFMTAMGGFHNTTGRAASWAPRDTCIPMAFHMLKYKFREMTGRSLPGPGALCRTADAMITAAAELYMPDTLEAITRVRAKDIMARDGWEALCAMETLVSPNKVPHMMRQFCAAAADAPTPGQHEDQDSGEYNIP